MSQKNNKGILGPLSWQYQKPDGYIFDNIESKVLEFYPAGYSQSFLRKMPHISDEKNTFCEQVNRQEFFKKLFDQAEALGREEEKFPFRGFKYKIELEPEPTNRFDRNAVKVVLSAPQGGDKVTSISYWNDYSIGYVPARINTVLLDNIERIEDIVILSVTDSLNDKFYCARIAVGYDGKLLIESDNLPERFLALI